MIEELTTLAELREHLRGRRRAIVNGLPLVDGAEVTCVPCRRNIHEDDEGGWTEARDGLLWDMTASHERCSNEGCGRRGTAKPDLVPNMRVA